MESKREHLNKYGLFIFLTLVSSEIVVSSYSPNPSLDTDQNLLQNFIEWYAVFYALALSIIIGESWRRYTNINTHIDREADALWLLTETADKFTLDSGNRERVEGLKLAVEVYVTRVRSLRGKDFRANIETVELMKEIRSYVDELIHYNKMTKPCVESELLNHFHQAYDARNDRFDILAEEMHPSVWFMFTVFSLIWVWGFLWLQFSSEALKNYVLGGTIFSISWLFFVARDLDDLKGGFWRMNFDPFKDNF